MGYGTRRTEDRLNPRACTCTTDLWPGNLRQSAFELEGVRHTVPVVWIIARQHVLRLREGLCDLSALQQAYADWAAHCDRHRA